MRDLGRPLRAHLLVTLVRRSVLAGVGRPLPRWQSMRPDRLNWSPPLLDSDDVLDVFIRGRSTIEQMRLPEHQLPVLGDASLVHIVAAHLFWSQASARSVCRAGSNILIFDDAPLAVPSVGHPHLAWWGSVVWTMTRPTRLLLPAERA